MTPPLFTAEDFKGWPFSDERRKCLADHANAKAAPLQAEVERLREENRKFRNALDEIAMWGLTRPMECGEGDDGDGHYKRIAMRIISFAAKARSEGNE